MSIYDSIGGAPAVRLAVDKFYGRVLNDPQLAPYFAGVSDIDKLKAHQRAFIAAAVGGPEIYRGRDMGAAHVRRLSRTSWNFEVAVPRLMPAVS